MKVDPRLVHTVPWSRPQAPTLWLKGPETFIPAIARTDIFVQLVRRERPFVYFLLFSNNT